MATTYPVSFSTVSDVLTTLPAVGSVSVISSADIAYAIGQSQAYVEAKLSGVYSMPFTSIPLLVNRIVTDLTIYRLSRRFAIFQKDNKGFDVYKDDSMQLIQDLIDGAIPLLDSSLNIVTQISNSSLVPWSNTKDYTPTFSEECFENQFLDEDKIDA